MWHKGLTGGGNLKVSRLALVSKEVSELVRGYVAEGNHNRHAELDSASDVVANHVERSAGKIPNQVWNDTAGQCGILTSLRGVRKHDVAISLQGFKRDIRLPRSLRSLAMTILARHGDQTRENSYNNLLTYSPTNLLTLKAHCAFTMAEILLSLTIIGVVAAITLPSLTGNINERTWNTQRKALYARMSQAVSLMPSLNGYGISGGVSSAVSDSAAETFLTAGLSKVLKINNICDAEHVADCGISSTYTNMVGSQKTWSSAPKLTELNSLFTSNYSIKYDTKAAAFETANGESVLVFYNPYCTADQDESSISMAIQSGVGFPAQVSQSKMCANLVYDLNGKKGPNTVGKDIGFMSIFYPFDPVVVAPIPLAIDAGEATHYNASALCQAQDSDSRLPNRDELSSIFYNKALVGVVSTDYWSSSVFSSTYAWYQCFDSGDRDLSMRQNISTVRCVKR